MRFQLIIIVVLFLWNCEDKQSSKQTTSTTPKDSIIQKPKETNKKVSSPEFPILSDDNAMEFFLEYSKAHKEDKVRITTDFGTIDIKLYDKTKFHRANFIYLTKRKYFDNTQFYRVVKNFVIQGGSSDGLDLYKKRRKIGKYLLPPDTKRGYSHQRGAISMPSSEIENAYKLASPFQFFIVVNREKAKHLDGDYTVFGEVIKGMDVVDKINAVKTDEGDWPIDNVYIRSVEIIK
ncbi:peptidylprolyl isomerase [Winogradskyella sp.]|jgi:cyclophilin family peptidyl-prolyl cis-trans isomerase|uniref:peptidylprolyl isomerase n=1 Tax=Winogradskyella sp. TaxID=1883156 RepID=UPI0025EF21D5|nr:peptidylprolyl isomerase [Winogradskyella sp.]MCT4628258.1 peptidylprolyl isomerase [Winogradskyella sp.]